MTMTMSNDQMAGMSHEVEYEGRDTWTMMIAYGKDGGGWYLDHGESRILLPVALLLPNLRTDNNDVGDDDYYPEDDDD